MMKDYQEYRTLQQFANAFARSEGMGKATEVVPAVGDKTEIIRTVECGYRKITTGEYVPNAYRNNFGWKNTYYQSLVCVVAVPEHIMQFFSEREKA
jgi:hypothetical protein